MEFKSTKQYIRVQSSTGEKMDIRLKKNGTVRKFDLNNFSNCVILENNFVGFAKTYSKKTGKEIYWFVQAAFDLSWSTATEFTYEDVLVRINATGKRHLLKDKKYKKIRELDKTK